MDYDSAKKVEPGTKDPVSAMFGKIIGSKIRYYLDASNAVERIGGMDEPMTRLSTGSNPQDIASLKSMFSEGYLKQIMSANLLLPQKPVEPGDTWPVQLEFAMGHGNDGGQLQLYLPELGNAWKAQLRPAGIRRHGLDEERGHRPSRANVP